MRLFLLRHAEAEPLADPDSARVLTRRGTAQAQAVGAYCQRHAFKPDLILASPYVRTMQTAHTIAEMLGGVITRAEPFLSSGMLPEAAFAHLERHQAVPTLMLVGHQPDLGLLLAAMLGREDPGGSGFAVASLASLTVEALARAGAVLDFLVSNEAMRLDE